MMVSLEIENKEGKKEEEEELTQWSKIPVCSLTVKSAHNRRSISENSSQN